MDVKKTKEHDCQESEESAVDLKNSVILSLSFPERSEEQCEELIEWSLRWWHEHGFEPYCAEGITATGVSLGLLLILEKEAADHVGVFSEELEVQLGV